MNKPSLSARFAAEEPEKAQLPVVRFTSHQLTLKGEVRSCRNCQSFESDMHDTCRMPRTCRANTVGTAAARSPPSPLGPCNPHTTAVST